MNETPFRKELKDNISRYVRNCRADGTVAMSIENLMQCVRTPSASLAGAPVGTNARYAYAQLFREVGKSSKEIKSFLL